MAVLTTWTILLLLPALLGALSIIWNSILLYMARKEQIANPSINYQRIQQASIAGLVFGIFGLGSFYFSYISFFAGQPSERIITYINYGSYTLGAIGVVLAVVGQILLAKVK